MKNILILTSLTFLILIHIVGLSMLFSPNDNSINEDPVSNVMVPVPADCERILAFGAASGAMYLTYRNKEGKILQARFVRRGNKFTIHKFYELEGTYDVELIPKK